VLTFGGETRIEELVDQEEVEKMEVLEMLQCSHHCIPSMALIKNLII